MVNSIFVNARAKSLSASLLGKERLNRMLDCDGVEDALKILYEVNFGGGLQISSAVDFERLIDAENLALFNFLRSYGIDENLSKFFLLKNDYHNAEAFIKSKHLKIDASDMIVPYGNIDAKVLKEKIFADDYSGLNEFMASALVKCDADFTSNKATGQSVNATFIKAYYGELYSYAKKDKNLKKIFSFKVDAINISVALRTRNYARAKDVFLANGNLTEEYLKALSDMPLESVAVKFTNSEYKELVVQAINEKIKGQPLKEFEKTADDFAIRWLKREKYQTAGNLPLLLYVYSKMSELNNVRIILVGLINGVDKNQIKNKLREDYEG